MAATQTLFHVLMIIFVAAAFAEFEVIHGPGENATLEAGCTNHSLVAWENNTAPFYAVIEQSRTFYNVNISGTLENITQSRELLQVLEGSMPIFVILRRENGTRPVICATPPTTPPEVDDTPLLITVYITSSLAIIFSVIALVTYLLFKPLRTLPGLVIMNLFLAFLLGDILLQIQFGLQYNGERVLELFALQQGLLITRFFWMSLTGFEMCRTLYKGVRLIGESQPREKWMLLAAYMFLGWGMGIFLTIIMYTVEKVSASKDVRNVLGLSGHLTTTVPVTLSLVINIGMVIFISNIFFGALMRQRRLKQNSYKKQNLNFVRLFLVLLTVLGIVWIVFFALAFTDIAREHVEVTIVYAILTDTQPIFVCIAFIFTPKVYKMYLVKFNIRTKEDFRKKSRRTGTLSSLYSERELQRGKTITSMVSEREFKSLPLPEKLPPTLHTIEEEAEEAEHSQIDEHVLVNSSAVSNGTTPTAVRNGTATTGAEDVHQKTEKLEENLDERSESLDKELSVEGTHPNTSTTSNGTTVTAISSETQNAVNPLLVNKGDSNPSLNSSHSSVNPDREETSV